MPTPLSFPQRYTLANPQLMPAFTQAVEVALGINVINILEQVAAGDIDRDDNVARFARGVCAEAERKRVAGILARMIADGWDRVLGALDYLEVYPDNHDLAGQIISTLDQIATQLNDQASPVSGAIVNAILQRIPAYSVEWLLSRGETPDQNTSPLQTLSLI